MRPGRATVALLLLLGGGLLLWSHREPRTHYEALGVAESAEPGEVKSAYRKLSLQYHPDKAPGYEERFHRISEAHDVLMDPQRRAAYDLELRRERAGTNRPSVLSQRAPAAPAAPTLRRWDALRSVLGLDNLASPRTWLKVVLVVVIASAATTELLLPLLRLVVSPVTRTVARAAPARAPPDASALRQARERQQRALEEESRRAAVRQRAGVRSAGNLGL